MQITYTLSARPTQPAPPIHLCMYVSMHALPAGCVCIIMSGKLDISGKQASKQQGVFVAHFRKRGRILSQFAFSSLSLWLRVRVSVR
jgi:hypothetical protein